MTDVTNHNKISFLTRFIKQIKILNCSCTEMPMFLFISVKFYSAGICRMHIKFYLFGSLVLEVLTLLNLGDATHPTTGRIICLFLYPMEISWKAFVSAYADLSVDVAGFQASALHVPKNERVHTHACARARAHAHTHTDTQRHTHEYSLLSA